VLGIRLNVDSPGEIMEDKSSLVGWLASDANRRAVLAILGVAATAAGAALLGAAAPARAQETQPKSEAAPPPPKRRSIAPPPAEPSAPAATSRGRATKDGDGESMPGGLPGNTGGFGGGTKRDSAPGGLPGARP
jgi:hypothetical protein